MLNLQSSFRSCFTFDIQSVNFLLRINLIWKNNAGNFYGKNLIFSVTNGTICDIMAAQKTSGGLLWIPGQTSRIYFVIDRESQSHIDRIDPASFPIDEYR